MDVFAYYLTGFIMLPVIIFSMICQAKVNSNFKNTAEFRILAP